MKELKEKIKKIPNSPGCYKYFNKKGELIYVGKAKNLKKRVSSYFLNKELDLKTRVLVENIRDIKWEITDSEIEALVLESLLIKKYKPKFNIKIKDDKDFLWVKIDLSQEYPYPELVRRPDKGAILQPASKGVKYFGPFTDSKLLKRGLAILRKVFLWRDCSSSKFSFYKKKEKPCLEYYIKNCSAPCQFDNNYYLVKDTNNKLLSNRNDYQLAIKQLTSFFDGRKKGLVKNLEREMIGLSKKRRFEEAAKVRDRLRVLQHIDAAQNIQQSMPNTQSVPGVHYPKGFIKKLNDELGYNLKFKPSFRIEFYDISNISGGEATGSMIVWQNGSFAKKDYRKFKIKTVVGPNDFKMMREVLARRIKRIEWRLPGLIILDGGKGQLGTVFRMFLENGIKIPLLSLAKREEEVFGVDYRLQIKNDKQTLNPKFHKLNISAKSPEGFFIQKLRDEAHRFAIGYHRILREKRTVSSRLDKIGGIGPKTKKKLLLKFGSVGGIMKASLSEVSLIVGGKLAEKIKEEL